MSTHDKPSEPLALEWVRSGLTLAPSDDECRAMAADLVRAMGTRRLAADALSIPKLTLDNWLGGKCIPTAPARRALWLTWCHLLHPERLRTAFDLLTWGRFR